MNEDTTKPSNEGSGRNTSKMREVDVRKVADSEIREAYSIRGFGDIRVLSTDPYVVDISRENNNSSSTSNASNGSGIIETESKAESNLDEIIAGNYIQAPLKQQDEKSKNTRKAKAAAKARENADKNKDEGLEK